MHARARNPATCPVHAPVALRARHSCSRWPARGRFAPRNRARRGLHIATSPRVRGFLNDMRGANGLANEESAPPQAGVWNGARLQ